MTTIAYAVNDSRPLQLAPTTEARARWEQFALAVFIIVPLLAVAAAGCVVWGHGLSLTDVVLSTVFSATTLHGITVGFHRYFAHGSFKAKRPLRIALAVAVAVSMAIEGPVTRWVADHRRHHADSDAEGAPHSPWRYGNDVRSPCNAPMSAGCSMSSRPISSGSPRTCSLTVMSPWWPGRSRSWALGRS